MSEFEPQPINENTENTVDQEYFNRQWEDTVNFLSSWGIDDLTPREILRLRQYLKEAIGKYQKDENDQNQAYKNHESSKATGIRMASVVPYEAAVDKYLFDYLGIDQRELWELGPISSVYDTKWRYPAYKKAKINNRESRKYQFKPNFSSQIKARQRLSSIRDKGDDADYLNYGAREDPKIREYIRRRREEINDEAEAAGTGEKTKEEIEAEERAVRISKSEPNIEALDEK